MGWLPFPRQCRQVLNPARTRVMLVYLLMSWAR